MAVEGDDCYLLDSYEDGSGPALNEVMAYYAKRYPDAHIDWDIKEEFDKVVDLNYIFERPDELSRVVSK